MHKEIHSIVLPMRLRSFENLLIYSVVIIPTKLRSLFTHMTIILAGRAVASNASLLSFAKYFTVSFSVRFSPIHLFPTLPIPHLHFSLRFILLFMLSLCVCVDFVLVYWFICLNQWTKKSVERKWSKVVCEMA